MHFHVVVPDGVFVRDPEGAVTFHEGPAPSRQEIGAIAARVQAVRWLRRRGLVDERPAEERSNERREPSPLAPWSGCMQMSLFGGAFLRLAADGTPVPVDDERFSTRTKSPWAAEAGGFDVHADVTVRVTPRIIASKLVVLVPPGYLPAARMSRPRRARQEARGARGGRGAP